MRHVVISSGSRCAPLVLAAGHHRGLRKWTNPDERSAAFTALGIGKESRRPAALICTSGTAAANYLPAVIEAQMSTTPLLVVTADRPPHLRNTGASQTIQQINLYGDYAGASIDLPAPKDRTSSDLWYWRAHNAVSEATNNRSPIHLNAPFDEPLFPTSEESKSILEHCTTFIPESDHIRPLTSASEVPVAEVESLVELIGRAKRPLFICGPLNESEDVAGYICAVARQFNAPILADAASQLRSQTDVISHHDLIVRDPDICRLLEPDVIVRIGGLPTSKVANQWFASVDAVAKIGISSGPVSDPDRCLTHALRGAIDGIFSGILRMCTDGTHRDESYYRAWMLADRLAAEVIESELARTETLLESTVVRDACSSLSADMVLLLSNSMAIRWAEIYGGARAGFPRVIVNRGANGIDGIVATASGIARSSGRRTVCILGDLTFLHDTNGLWRLTEENIPLTMILLNNSGGGVFHFLPIVEHTEVFEPLVAMPHRVNLAGIATAHAVTHRMVNTRGELVSAIRDANQQNGPMVVEIQTDRARNHDLHQKVVSLITNAIRTALRRE